MDVWISYWKDVPAATEGVFVLDSREECDHEVVKALRKRMAAKDGAVRAIKDPDLKADVEKCLTMALHGVKESPARHIPDMTDLLAFMQERRGYTQFHFEIDISKEPLKPVVRSYVENVAEDTEAMIIIANDLVDAKLNGA